jgi:hypothetical protein
MRKLSALVFAGLLFAASVVPAFAATSTQSATTTVTVNTSIVLTGVPATIAFGAGAPSDVVTAPGFTANVVSNNRIGYTIGVVTSNMASAGSTNTIPATAFTWAGTSVTCAGGSTCAGASGSPTDTTTPVQVASATKRTAEAGDTFTIASSLTLPFVDSGAYTGTAVFTATSL